MAIVQLSEAQKELVERLGVAQERMGISPAASRILALLTVANDPEITFEDIYETLNLSKSSTSNALNMLIAMNRVEYITKHGDRKRYFRASMVNMAENFGSKFEEFLRIRTVLMEILEQRPSTTPEFNAKLADLAMFMDFMHRELPMLIERWKTEVANR